MTPEEGRSPSRRRRQSRGESTTLLDVARAAGVSLATASRVLNGSERKVAASYRERVEAAAAELGYTANVSAQATARGRSPVIALLVGDIADPYFGLIASGVAQEADQQGLVVTISITERDPAREARIVRALRGQRPRGLILAASRTTQTDDDTQRELAAFTRFGGRIVTLGPGVADHRTVLLDNRGGAEELGRRMGERGYRRAIVVAASEGYYTSDERQAGFSEGFAATGGTVERVYRSGFLRESGVEAMSAALVDGVDPGTLVFGVTDVVAIGAMAAIRDAGREIGDDIAVCGFDDVPASRDVSPPLTTVWLPLVEVGHQAFRAIVEADWTQDEIPHEVLVRASTPGIMVS